MPSLCNSTQQLVNSSSARPCKVPTTTDLDFDAHDVYAMLSSSEGAGKSSSQPVDEQQHPNVARILLEMQAFRYVDSETDISRSITPSSLNRDYRAGSNKSLDEIAHPHTPISPAVTSANTTTSHGILPVTESPRSFSPIIHQNPPPTVVPLSLNPRFSAVSSHMNNMKMTPLMELSIEESASMASQVLSARPSTEPSVWSQEGGPSGASSLRSSVGGQQQHLVIINDDSDDVDECSQLPLWPAYENWVSVLEYRSPLSR